MKAFHPETHALVAIKVCPKKYIDAEQEICPLDYHKTIPLEAYAMMICKHDGIISLFSCLEDDLNWYNSSLIKGIW